MYSGMPSPRRVLRNYAHLFLAVERELDAARLLFIIIVIELHTGNKYKSSSVYGRMPLH